MLFKLNLTFPFHFFFSSIFFSSEANKITMSGIDDYRFASREARIRLTTGCNYHCFFCHEEGGCDAPAAEWRELRDLLLALRAQKRKEITFTGGEPLLQKPVLLKALAEIASWDEQPYVTVVTNGSRLDEEVISALEACKKAKIHVSIHDPQTEMYQLITKQEKTTAEQLRPLLKRASAGHVLLKLNAVLTHKLVANGGRSLDSLLNFARDVGAKCIKFIELLETKDASSWPMKPLSVSDMNDTLEKRKYVHDAERDTPRTNYWHTPDGLLLEVTRVSCILGPEYCEAIRGDSFTGTTLYHPCFSSPEAIPMKGRPLEEVLTEGEKFLEEFRAAHRCPYDRRPHP